METNTGGNEQKVLREYFEDLYGLFQKRLTQFVIRENVAPEDTVKLLAMLQELIKVKKLIK